MGQSNKGQKHVQNSAAQQRPNLTPLPILDYSEAAAPQRPVGTPVNGPDIMPERTDALAQSRTSVENNVDSDSTAGSEIKDEHFLQQEPEEQAQAEEDLARDKIMRTESLMREDIMALALVDVFTKTGELPPEMMTVISNTLSQTPHTTSAKFYLPLSENVHMCLFMQRIEVVTPTRIANSDTSSENDVFSPRSTGSSPR